ncbi:calpain-A-like [Metopolophium dirhodum]|uniref:calpain-A-like n=1 Tax=Metopolophium dirhodum TaxID=44670 RepID=UPI0029907B17|nr:calpain-A-like [Metopolophium dirhodum]XP_060856221.1 calpain-A-like [Metopolophium dirhodum]
MLNVGERGSGVRQRPAGFDQNFDELRSKCLKQKILFKDPEFDTYDLSLSHRNLRKNQLEWRRPKEITDDPKFFVQGSSRFDVQQGKLGDCWLLAAIANLTLDDKLFYKVVPFDQGFHINYAGIFHFQFWQFGRWVDVVIDDRLPTSKGNLLFLQSSAKNEFWSALLEKAYAKLNGSYKALEGGFTMEAMGDFTGGVSEMYDLNKEQPNLFTIMLNSFQRQSLMCGVIFDSQLPDPEKKGLIKGHAYSITRITYIPLPTSNSIIPLIRLRNPWGDESEWNGRWSDKSEEWLNIPQQLKQSIGLKKEDDGEFWMPFEDFVKYFSAVEICHLNPGYLDREQYGASGGIKWDLSIFQGEWVRGATAGGCDKFKETFSSNPQYYITIVDPDENDNNNMCTVIIALMLKDTRFQKNQQDISLSFGFYVYNLNTSKSVPKPLDTHFFENNDPLDKVHCSEFKPREVCKRLIVPPGKYCIIPYTSNQNEQGVFLLRVFSEKKNNLAEFDNEVGMVEIDDKIKKLALYSKKSDDSNEKLKKYFLKVAGSDKEVDWMDLKNILDFSMKDTGNSKFSNDVCRCFIAMMDWDRSGKLGFKEFERLLMDIRQWQVVFKTYDKKNKGYIKGFELRPALSSVGYHIKTRTINTMCHRYANKKGYIMFDDFIMCAIRLKTTIDIFKEHDPGNKNVVSFTLEEWVEKTFYS